MAQFRIVPRRTVPTVSANKVSLPQIADLIPRPDTNIIYRNLNQIQDCVNRSHNNYDVMVINISK